MQPGKLPHDTLARLLGRLPHDDPRVILGPGIGRDAAVIDTGGPNLLVAKADPITFASDMIGWYAVHVNANDVACTGARPLWFLATILLPEGSTPDLAESVFRQMQDAATPLGIEIVGGHTEITIGLDRPIVSGALLGEVERGRLVRPDGARPGDALILTKGIAIEGTAVVAREAPERLKALAVREETIERARDYLLAPGISVVAEAAAAASTAPVHAMHDPTEGGLATALHEMTEAAGAGIEVDEGAIDVLPETRAVCDAAGLDPLGLLASGSLLIATAEADCEAVTGAIESAGVAARRIGRFLEPSPERVIMVGEARTVVPRFSTDEVARFLGGHGSPSDNQHPRSEGEGG